ncbi:kinase domain-containing protein [Penicillium chermesinum]|uniref:non-specific serine/threonine protein kinase n=1 Tax=Penicillium chermesinum TaxID=63820 RepID=A0A9W9TI93_9EURO|nr:kinase domain-containing protein [Penicillium chermesinum]KAJ5223776.1 kinase domain-containing protein [Penicillium chermesinum]
MSSLHPLPSRRFPTSGFVKLDLSQKIEEEKLPGYVAEDYFPVYIGEVFASRYQVVSKLGYGMSSTAWLCRDLRSLDHGFRTLKICVRGKPPAHEMAISDHLKASDDHSGKKLVRLVLDSFEVIGPHGKHTCLVYQPLGMSFTEFQDLCPDEKLPKDLIQRSLQLILISLAFMHNNNVVHTDISSNNILQGVDDSSILSQIEEDEMKRPIARKVLADRHIYYSRPMPVSTGLPVLSDLGEARAGNHKHRGDIMPGIYRAPEVVLNMDWDCKVDIWSIGVMAWDLAQGHHLFFAKKDRVLDDEQHLAEMVSLMGPPPPEYLAKSDKAAQYWDDQGNWNGSIPVPTQSLEKREQQFLGEDKELFLNFLRRILRWLPEERPTAEELAYDDFLMQPVLQARAST